MPRFSDSRRQTMKRVPFAKILVAASVVAGTVAAARPAPAQEAPAPATREPGSVSCFENRASLTQLKSVRRLTQKQVVVA